jgi:hypothetical protein
MNLKDYSKLDLSKYPDIHSLEGDISKILLVLHIVKEEMHMNFLTPSQISDILLNHYYIDVPRQRIFVILDKEKKLAAKRKIKSLNYYTILKAGIDLINDTGNQIAFMVNPTAAYTGVRKVQEVFASLQGEIYICDPYVDEKTLDYLASVKKECKIQLLTVNVNHPGPFRRAYEAYRSQFGNLEVRVLQTGTVHDRYVIDCNGMFLIGQSLNGVGKKQMFVVSLGEDLRRQTIESFKRSWSQSPVY